jgi:hypothetical protein
MSRLSSSGGGGGSYDYVQPGAPADAVEGETWYDTDDDEAYVYDGASWHQQTVTAHGELGNVTSDQHHSPPTSTQAAPTGVSRGASDSRSGTFEGASSYSYTVSVSSSGGRILGVWWHYIDNSSGGSDDELSKVNLNDGHGNAVYTWSDSCIVSPGTEQFVPVSYGQDIDSVTYTVSTGSSFGDRAWEVTLATPSHSHSI